MIRERIGRRRQPVVVKRLNSALNDSTGVLVSLISTLLERALTPQSQDVL